MAAPIPVFTWTSTGNYPAGGNAWNGQPLALAPAQSYFTPALKPAAEEFNDILGQIAGDLAAIDTYLQKLPLGFWQLFEATTTGIIVPANCFWMFAVLCGGGGGGEAGCLAEFVVSGSPGFAYALGGGGAGAPLVSCMFPTVPGDTIAVTIGAAGAGGTGSLGGGSDGGSTIIQCTAGVLAGTTYVTAPGGAGCGVTPGSLPVASPAEGSYLDCLGVIAPGAVGLAGSAASRMAPYGTGPTAYGWGFTAGEYSQTPLQAFGGNLDVGRFERRIPQRGGSVFSYWSSSGALFIKGALDGAQAPATLFTGSGGGSAGTPGTATGTLLGGCPGGGGGAGAFGQGGGGGNGGAGSTSSGLTSGGNAGANSGGGGGGGGQPGQANAIQATTVGGNGGSGKAYLFGIGGNP